MLGERLRRWANVKTTLAGRLLGAPIRPLHIVYSVFLVDSSVD